MGLLKTFGEVKASRVLQVAASCASSAEFQSLVNEATDILLQRGDWPGTVIPARFIVRRGCVTWPRWVGRVRRINQCRMPLNVRTMWWDFVDRENYAGWSGRGYYWNGCSEPIGQSTFQHHRGFGSLVSEGKVPTYNDIPADAPRYVRAYPQNSLDIGKKVTLFGIDANGQQLMTTNPDNTMSLGVTISIAAPFGSTSGTVQRIDAVQKDITQGPVSLYSYEPVSNTMLDLAIYEPSETNPSYAKDRLFPAGARECGCDMTVIALIKLAFIPVTVDSDYVLIPSVSALKKAIQAIKFGEAGDVQNQAAFMQSAVNDLNSVMNNEIPIEQTPVDTGFGGEQFALGMQSVI